jgi:hypothetical protein
MKRNTQRTLFWVAIVALLMPLVLVHYFPSADGPSHVLNASLLNRMLFQGDPQLKDWFTLNPVAVPNWSGHLILMVLLPILSGPVAERVLVGIYVLGFLLAFRYMLRGLARETQGWEFMALPLVYNMHLYWGFYNFCLSLAAYLFLLGFFLRHEGAWNRVRVALLACLALLLYLSHGLMFLFGLLTVILLPLVRRRSDLSGAFRAMCIPALAFLPAVLLYIDFALFRVRRADSIVEWPQLRYSASLLFSLSPLASFVGPERLLAAAYALLVYGLVALRLWQLRHKWPAPELLCLALVGALSVFLMPVTASGGTMITPRLVYLPVFVLIGWLVCAPIPRPWPLVGAALSIAIAASMQLVRIPLYRVYDREMTQLSASLTPQVHPAGLYAEDTGKLIGPLTNSGRSSAPDISPSALAFLGVSKKAMILSNYEAHQDHFPLLFRQERDPYDHIIRYLAESSTPSNTSFQQVDGFLFWCNSRGLGMCATDRLGDFFQLQKLPGAPQEARWFARSTSGSAKSGSPSGEPESASFH